MMRIVPVVAAVIIGLLLAYVLGEGLIGAIAFGIAGLLGGRIARIMPPGSEWVYWLFVLATLALFLVSVFQFSLDERIVMFPLVFTAGYFVARLILRVTGRKAARPS